MNENVDDERVSRRKILIRLGIPAVMALSAIVLLVLSSVSVDDKNTRIQNAYDVEVVSVIKNRYVDKIQIRDGGALRECNTPTYEEIESKTPMTCILLNPAR